MSSARDKVQAMIRRKMAKNSAIKEKLRDRDDPEARILRFLEEFDSKLLEAKKDSWHIYDINQMIDAETKRLLGDLALIDPEVGISLVWFGDDLELLRLEGVRIEWSEKYSDEHSIPREQLVDVASVLFR